MIGELLNYIKTFIDLRDEDVNFMNKKLEVRTYKKGSLILEEGQISREFYFNQSGLVRLFYNNDGVDNTAFFYEEGQFVSAYESFLRQIPAKQNFQALEDCNLVVITVALAEELLNFNSSFEFLARVAMEEELIVCQKIIESLLSKTPEERYLELIENNPSYFQRVPQHYIASFIGVKPESLSRIKKRYFNNLK